jgi:hypothetical protein
VEAKLCQPIRGILPPAKAGEINEVLTTTRDGEALCRREPVPAPA